MMKQNRLNWLIPLVVVVLAAVLLVISRQAPEQVQQDMVIISVAGEEYTRVPLNKPDTLVITQETGEVNTITITGTSVYMAESNCKNQQCVHMGEVSRDNWEFRVNQEFIICLPNQVVIELRVAE